MRSVFSHLRLAALRTVIILLRGSSLYPRSNSVLLSRLGRRDRGGTTNISRSLGCTLHRYVRLLNGRILRSVQAQRGVGLRRRPISTKRLALRYLHCVCQVLFVLFVRTQPRLNCTPVHRLDCLGNCSLRDLQSVTSTIQSSISRIDSNCCLRRALTGLCSLVCGNCPRARTRFRGMANTSDVRSIFLVTPLGTRVFSPRCAGLVGTTGLHGDYVLHVVSLVDLAHTSNGHGDHQKHVSCTGLNVGRVNTMCRTLLSCHNFVTRRSLCRIGHTKISFGRLSINCFISRSSLTRCARRRHIHCTSNGGGNGLHVCTGNAFVCHLTNHRQRGSTSCCAPRILAGYLIGCTLGRLLGSGSTSSVLRLAVYRPTVNDTTFLGRTVGRLTRTCVSHGRRRAKRVVNCRRHFGRLRGIGVFVTSHGMCNISLGPITIRLTRISL